MGPGSALANARLAGRRPALPLAGLHLCFAHHLLHRWPFGHALEARRRPSEAGDSESAPSSRTQVLELEVPQTVYCSPVTQGPLRMLFSISSKSRRTVLLGDHPLLMSGPGGFLRRPAIAATLVRMGDMNRGAEIAVDGLHLREREGVVERRGVASESSGRYRNADR